jgi:cohesin loading factor subunit SCC2
MNIELILYVNFFKKHKKSDIAIENLDQKEIFNLQKSLVLHLDGMAGGGGGGDTSLKFAKFFLVGQWLKELNQQLENNMKQQPTDEETFGQARLEKHAVLEELRKNVYNVIDNASNMSSVHQPSSNLDMSEAFILSKYLSSLKKTLDKNFDYYLINILNLSGAGNDSNVAVPTQVRSKAIKCLSLIIEADPQILLKPKVFSCVEANFLHQTISVREASVDLIGRFITLKPDLTYQYYKLLSDRILDVGVSVRKRVIKVFRDVCVNQPDFEHLVEICVKILRRINDEDAIKKLVIDHFYSIWFAPLSSKEALFKRVLNIVDVVSELNLLSNNASLEIFEQLFNSLLSVSNTGNSGNTMMREETSMAINNTPGSVGGGNAPSSNEQENQIARAKDVLKSCKQIVDCLIENVLNTEANTNSPQAYKRLVACFTALHVLSKIKPENFINHAETLLPYLNIKSTVTLRPMLF